MTRGEQELKRLGFACAAAALACLALGPGASANTIVPDTRADEPGLDPDNGNCTLREAVESADHDVSDDACTRGDGADVIKLKRGTYELDVPGDEPVGSAEADNSIGDLDISLVDSSPLKIVGHKRGTTIDGNDHDRVLQVFGGGEATFIGLTITDGDAVNTGGGASVFEDASARFVRTTVTENLGAGGGGVSVEEGGEAKFEGGAIQDNDVAPDQVGGGISTYGDIELDGTKVIGNDAGQGGGILLGSGTSAKLKRARVERNEATSFGGGIEVGPGAQLTVSESAISRNTSGASGGGIDVFQGAVKVTASTVSKNEANGGGGGIATGGSMANPSALEITNSTISGNTADADETSGGSGGGVSAGSFGSKEIISSTITDNSADVGGGIAGPFISGLQPVQLKGTIVAGNTALNASPGNGHDCRFVEEDSGESLGHNLIGDPDGSVMDTKASDRSGDPGLGPLRRNGGPTQTHALMPASQAINRGPPDAPGRDQRGVRREDPDIGAFERA